MVDRSNAMTLRIPKWIVTPLLAILIGGYAIYQFGRDATVQEGVNSNSRIAATVFVKSGYLPRLVELPADVENVIRFQTKNTYDCSASLVIPRLGIERLLPPNGTVDISVPPQPAGTEVTAGCSMGMYSFVIRFTDETN
ncbi:MAG: hypothetical protein QY312_04155 [Candidatus Dojkabacteria bacterium]|nr:MAG: hypothetical protein QY312_04155 [Candidatus Dojkabacteria bacterium]